MSPRSSVAIRIAGLLIGLGLLLHSGPVFADARSKARKRFEEGMRLIESKRFSPGIEALIQANEILPHPDVQYNIARACVDAGLISEAIQWFETYLQQPAAPGDEADVKEAIRSLRARIAPPVPAPARPEGDELPPGEAPADEALPKRPLTSKPPLIPEDATRDLKRLDQLADDMKPLAADRAKELTAIAAHIRDSMRALAARSGGAAEGGVTRAPARKAKLGGGAEGAGVDPKGNERRPAEIKADDPPSTVDPRIAAPASPRLTGDLDGGKRAEVPLKLGDQGLRSVEEYKEQEVVTAATRRAARVQDAPAVVWVITQKEIRQRGYESVAEALRAVAGLHVIDDHVFVDVGVRGVHSGLRGESRVIKVLIDDQPVAFRPTSGNFLGPEMIPIRAVDRIELIRGPASALYGANAFLGVLQIVTRRGGDIGGGSIAVRGGLMTSTRDARGKTAPQAGGSADFVVGTKSGDLSVLLSGQIAELNRSGLQLPSSSPFVNELKQARGDLSANDIATPVSLFGSLSYQLRRAGTLTLQGGLQRLNAKAEWLDYGALTHFSRVSLTNSWARLDYDVQVSKETGFRAFTSLSQGGPNEQNRIQPLEGYALSPNESRHLVEDYSSRAIFSGAEMRWEPKKYGFGARAGLDVDVDFQSLPSARAVFDRAEGANNPGSSIPVAAASLRDRTFSDVGAYLQLSSSPISILDMVGGLRYDYHDIYGSALSGRLGAVLRASEHIFFKALYGSSFRAPAADQLYHGPAFTGDTRGCRDYAPCAQAGLRPQRAHTAELVAGVTVEELLTAQITGFVSFVDDFIITFPINANSVITSNAGTYSSKGLELELSSRPLAIGSAIRVASHAYFALQNTSTNVPQSLFTPPESVRAEYRPASLFPNVSGGGGLDFALLPARLGLYLEARYVGPRRASGSNLVLSLGDTNYENDSLPGYVEIDANLSTRELYLFQDVETVLSLRVTDLLAARHVEGGYRGWDIPTLGRTVFFRVIQEY